MDGTDKNFTIPDELSDVVLIVEGQKLYAHRLVNIVNQLVIIASLWALRPML